MHVYVQLDHVVIIFVLKYLFYSFPKLCFSYWKRFYHNTVLSNLIHQHSEDKVKNTYATNALLFICFFLSFKQALKFSSVEKVDNVLTSLLRNKISTYEFSLLQIEEEHHHQASESLILCTDFYYWCYVTFRIFITDAMLLLINVNKTILKYWKPLGKWKNPQ